MTGLLRPRLPGLGLWLILCVPPLIAFDGRSGVRWWATAAAFPLLALAVLVRRRLPLVSVALPVLASLAVSRDLFTVAYCLPMAVFGALAGVRMPRARPALWTFTALAAAGLPLSALADRTIWPWFSALLTLLLLVVLPWLLGRYRRQYGELVRTGWQLAARMEREQRAVADGARLRERTRIAGDMHDSLGHDLALIALRAGALEVDPGLDPRRREAAGELRAAAGAATERLQEIIGVLRTDDENAPPAPADASVTALVRRARESGMTVTLEGADDDAPVAQPPPMTGHALHRIVQESLTNAAKHAPGADVRVRIERSPERLDITVASGPRPAGPAPDPVSGGSGLVGLAERVRLAGGTLQAGPAPEGGFTVAASLPTAGGASPTPLKTPEPTTPQWELAQAQHRVRRRLRQTVSIPSALLAALVALMGVSHLVIPSWTVLDRARYDGLHIGMPRTEAEKSLPFFALDAPPDGTPPPPHGWSCTYYSIGTRTAAAYELCFAGGRLARKALVRRAEP
ncbi:sensor histidine kinase [Streptomyces chattanoogensis]|uniref:sensor histidine kinase n=1 Tax=Streptomyces chattanoogensis TaxID=66876 RepID=UPI0036839D5C